MKRLKREASKPGDYSNLAQRQSEVIKVVGR